MIIKSTCFTYMKTKNFFKKKGISEKFANTDFISWGDENESNLDTSKTLKSLSMKTFVHKNTLLKAL